MDWLEKGVEVQSGFFMWIDVFPEFRTLRGESPFRAAPLAHQVELT